MPALWHLEMANGLAISERRRILAAADVLRALTYVEQLSAVIETSTDLIPMRQALNTASAFHLSAYEAVYLDLARTQSLPLATLDSALREAATRAGVDILR